MIKILESYISCKVVRGEPMTESKFRNRPITGEDRDGYRVIYPDGYESWSPKKSFDDSHRKVTKGEKQIFIDEYEELPALDEPLLNY